MLDNKDEMTIEDLKMPNEGVVVKENVNNAEQEIVEMSIEDIKPYSPKADPVSKNIDNLFSKIDTAISSRIERDDELIVEKLDDLKEKELEKEIEDDTSLDEKYDLNEDNYSSDDNFFEDLKSEDATDKENDKQLELIRNTIKEKIKPVTDAVDLSSFTVSKKHIAVTKTLDISDNTKNIADWMLFSAKKPVSISEFTGYEIEKLNPASSNRNRYNAYRDIYTSIYNHIVDTNKPHFDIWLKNISFYDIPHLYFAIYKACFDGVNNIPYACTNKDCNHVFMNDCDTANMVKYKDDVVKSLVLDILNGNTNSENPEDYEAEITQISNKYAVSFREPSIWNIIFENAILEEKFTDKYSDFLAIMAYIDEVYFINRSNNQLEPIQVEVDLNNPMKTVKSRIVKYSEVFKTLTSDQFQFLQACVKRINDRYDGVSYILPETVCPKCGTLIKEQEMEPDQLLFTRHQLAAIANI